MVKIDTAGVNEERSTMKIICFSLFTLIGLMGCSSNSNVNHSKKNQAFRNFLQAENIEKTKKIVSFNFHGWNSLTDEFLIISSSRKRQYLLELNGFCHEIRWAHSILINRTTSSTLQAKFDSISTIESPEMKCFIKTIYPLTPEQKSAIKAMNKPDESSKENSALENKQSTK